MPEIGNTISELRTYLEANCPNEQNVHLIDNIPLPIKQRGQTCKLYALGHAMRYVSINYPDSPTFRPPIRKEPGMLKFLPSLRHQAKANYGSAVGEVYDLSVLMKLAQDNGYESSYIAPMPEDYCDNIKEIIDESVPAVIFFDIDVDGLNKGEPTCAKGFYEHSVTVVGYYYDLTNELRFICLNWGCYFDYCANDIAKSSFQLQTRVPETFYKLSAYANESFWVEKSCLGPLYSHLASNRVKINEERKAKDLSNDHIGMNGKILLVTTLSMELTPPPSIAEADSLEDISQQAISL